MAVVLAHAVFRTLEHQLEDLHRGDVTEVQILSLWSRLTWTQRSGLIKHQQYLLKY